MNRIFTFETLVARETIVSTWKFHVNSIFVAKVQGRELLQRVNWTTFPSYCNHTHPHTSTRTLAQTRPHTDTYTHAHTYIHLSIHLSIGVDLSKILGGARS